MAECNFSNCTQNPRELGLEEPVTLAGDGKFFVTLTEEVYFVRAGVLPMNVHVLIDPGAVPKEMDTVLVANRLELWERQPEIRGVAIQYHECFR